jgi:cyclophilin family peptidyl-prolyl cis-trans isomerase/HEAT repeat protein
VAPVVTWAQKIGWIVRLEDQRILRDPNPPPREVIRPATLTEPALLGPPPPSDLIALLDDADAPVRMRAALAIGRVGLADGVAPLVRLLSDEEADVRQHAAFALGLIGDASARQALLAALLDARPLVQGRAAEALSLIGDRADATAVSTMVRAHVQAGAIEGVEPDDLSYPLSPEVEAVRLGIYALARFGLFAELSAAVIRPDGQPVSRWWPVAFALQRMPDGQASPWLLPLLDTPGRYTASFAAKGLATRPSPESLAALQAIVERRSAHPAVVVQAMRTLATAGAGDVAPALVRILGDRSAEVMLRIEAAAAFGALAGRDEVDLLLDLLSDSVPTVRGLAMRALARVDGDTFLAVLAGLDADPDWTVRVAQAQALGTLPDQRGLPRLRQMLDDGDVRVLPEVVSALVSAGAPDAERLATDRLRADDFVVRASAASALAEVKAVGAVPRLVEAYRAARADETYVARAAVLTALNLLDPAAARPLLQEALGDKDWALRVRAAALLRDSGVPVPPGAIRPATAGSAIDDPEWQRIVLPPFTPLAYIETSKGTVELELAVVDAPLTTESFMRLARSGLFEGAAIHRIVPDFVVQDGDPRGDGQGGPGYTIRDEINGRPYLRGTVGMALDWEDTGGSQFFITHSPQPHLDARYTVFGQVVRGMDVVDALAPGDVIERVRIWDGVNEP